MGELAFISSIYDLTASGTISNKACTGVLVPSAEGAIIHGRTLDYSLRAAMLGITAVVDFQRGGMLC